MNTLIVWDRIYEDLKGSFSAELFGLLFGEAEPVFLTNDRLVIQVDPISFSFLQDESTLNYQKFVHVCRAHLGKEIKIKVVLPEEGAKTKEKQQSFEQNQTPNEPDPTADFLNEFIGTENSSMGNQMGNDSFKQSLIDDHPDVDLFQQTMDLSVFLNADSFELEPQEMAPVTAPKAVINSYAETKLSRTYSFNNYFYSHENQKIIRACKEIIGSISKPSFNPVFIYGESGIGKTHLINALGNEIFDLDSNYNIKYTTGPNFLTEFTGLFQGGINDVDAIDNFKNVYYNLDVLIIDDIQLLEGKESSLKEFFSIFENLLQAGKQVIITADKKPDDIQFEQRLITRFLSGLALEIRTPDSDTKKQIFNYYAVEKELKVDEDAIQIFIDNSNSVRALLGYINAIHMHFLNDDLESSSFTKMDALEFVNSTTGNMHNYTPKEIIAIVVEHFDIDEEQLKKRSRKSQIVTARAFAAYFLQLKLKLNYKTIADYIGVKEHTTAMRAIKRIEDEHSKPKYKDDFIKLSNKLNR